MPVDSASIETALALIAEGASLREAARKLEIPTSSLYYAIASVAPEQYARARDSQAEIDADAVRAIAEEVRQGLDPAAARVAMDALKWSAGKRAPKKFGEKIVHQGDASAPLTIQVVTGVDRSAD